MICPKCGFNQPEDIYCARCGVHVKKYSRNQKKKLAFILSLFTILAVAALLTGRIYPEREARVTIVRSPSPVAPPKRRSSPPKRPSPANHEGQKEKASVAGTETRTAAKPQASAAANRSKKHDSGQKADEKESALTAPQWFDKGRALNDDSTEEISSYQKALELAPAFAPAYYRLGAIYFRNAEYELADQAFARFLKFATDEQKGIFDIYIFYSPREVENLGLEEETPDSTVVAEKQSSDQENPGPPAQGENREGKSGLSKEVQTSVPFESQGDHIIVSVRLNGDITARMLLDTGAGITVLTTTLAKRLHLNLDGARTIRLKTLARVIHAPLTSLPRLQLGEQSIENLPVAIFSMRPPGEPFDGILGMDFLQGLTITVDVVKKKISLSSSGTVN